MKEIYALLAELGTNQRMVHFKRFPSGTYHANIYCFVTQQTYLYDQPTAEKFYAAMMKDWSHLLHTPTPFPKLQMPKPLPMPKP